MVTPRPASALLVAVAPNLAMACIAAVQLLCRTTVILHRQRLRFGVRRSMAWRFEFDAECPLRVSRALAVLDDQPHKALSSHPKVHLERVFALEPASRLAGKCLI